MKTLWIVGCGTMASAMLSRWLATGMDPARVTVITPTASRSDVRVLRAIPDEAPPTMLLLGVKPQMLGDVVAALQSATTGTMLLSILAGTPIATLKSVFPGARGWARIMPNLPVAIGKGAVALHADAEGADHNAVATLMAPLGVVEWIENEAHFDAVTALSGSGPAFVYRFIEALAHGGAAMGLPADQAVRLALATVEGAGSLAAASNQTLGELANQVAAKGGSTRSGLEVFDRDQALAALVAAALRASEQRNRELAALTHHD